VQPHSNADVITMRPALMGPIQREPKRKSRISVSAYRMCESWLETRPFAQDRAGGAALARAGQLFVQLLGVTEALVVGQSPRRGFVDHDTGLGIEDALMIVIIFPVNAPHLLDPPGSLAPEFSPGDQLH